MKIEKYSKSQYCALWHCPKLAWLSVHKPEEMVLSDDGKTRLEAGREVGELAKALFGEYTDVTAYDGDRLDIHTMKAATLSEMAKETPVICEAAFEYNGLYCAVDILRRENDGWAIYEVKSSTKALKDVYIADVSYQQYVLEHCGVNVTGIYIVCLNRDYVFDGTLSLSQLFKVVNVTEQSTAEQSTVAENLAMAAQLLSSKEEPEMEISRNCRNPYPCAFWEYCSRDLPEPEPQYDHDHIDRENIRNFLNGLWYPLYFLDFETLQPVVPQYIGTRPYDQIPFQYSLHYIEHEGREIKHSEFLAEPGTDPRRSLANQLCADIPAGACVTAYNKAFECTRLRELAAAVPDLAEPLMSIQSNIIDLMVPFQKLWYYKPAMGERYSIKSVLPALYPGDPDLDYHNLEEVHNGSEAMMAFPAMEKMSPEEQKRTRKNLLRYCGLDTYAMVKVWEKLVEAVQR